MMYSMPLAASSAASALAIAARSMRICTSPGGETSRRSGVVSSTMPILRPSLVVEVDLWMQPRSTRAARAGTSEKSRLAEMNGSRSQPGNPSMKSASTPGPKSNSWLPMV